MIQLDKSNSPFRLTDKYFHHHFINLVLNNIIYLFDYSDVTGAKYDMKPIQYIKEYQSHKNPFYQL